MSAAETPKTRRAHAARAGAVLGTWSVEYAKSGRSMCRASHTTIPFGDLRIGKEVESSWLPGSSMTIFYKPEALFETFRKGPISRSLITRTDQLIGFDGLNLKDQLNLDALIRAENAFRDTLNEAESQREHFKLKHADMLWSILQAGALTRVIYGLESEESVVVEKRHDSEVAASKLKAKMIREKLKKGYTPIKVP
jgi:hypothetical protein